ncbi:MAG: hypothetical protein WCP08_16930 [Prolixibacteraceae bacterium]
MKSIMNPFAKVASAIFGIIALLHLLRLTFQYPEIVVGDFKVPLWISIIGLIVTAVLCIGLWKEAIRKG